MKRGFGWLRCPPMSEERKAEVRDFVDRVMSADDGWGSMPTDNPLEDLNYVLYLLHADGHLRRVNVTLVPAEERPGWWDVLLVQIEKLPGEGQSFIHKARRLVDRGRGRFTRHLVDGKPQDPVVNRPPGDAVNRSSTSGEPTDAAGTGVGP